VTIRGKVVGVHPEQMKSAEVSNEPSAEIFFEPPPPITSAGNQEQSYAATVAQSDTSPTSDLIERRVNSLLAKAEQAEDKGDWKTAADAYEDVLMLAPGRADVERLLERARNRFSKTRFTFLLNRTKKPALVIVGIVIAVAVLAGIRSGINLLDRKLESQPQGQAQAVSAPGASQTQRPVEKTIQPAKTDQKIDAEREYELGRQFFYGWGRPIDFQEAFIHLRLAAEQGHRSAAEMLKAMGKFGYQTDGKRHDPYASTRGQAPPKTDQTVDAEEAFRLGEKYLYGRGVTRNYPKAAQYYSYAAERGHSEAMHSLGWVYEHGVGVQKDLWAAREWYRKAAELGHQNAKTALQRLSR